MRSVEELVRVAIEARAHAYAPYSGYRVGAAIETDSGEIVSGCNVENLSYGATICAERTAITRMIASNLGTKVRKIAVASKDGVTPCGICLQVLNEFVDDGDAVVVCVSEDGSAEEFKFRQLMPHAFQSSSVRRTESPRDEV
jgi:cytidine deaminase